ncbi:DNA replication complex GINS protein PSF3-like isoform X2 [Malus domestica]|uniref:DNA replication complex GINS protein PSF3-like isoform X2 n=1 Tax=Malus domestica TaxID=3750 RepID=UPI0010A9F937|nr:DNA replication complex GINS protein PSF3-like isoform X2 [Malus domestica]
MANYYDIDDIIMEQQLVPVVFHKAVNGVEIDPSAETDYVEAGSKVELPLWLAYELHLKQVVKMKVPACFNHRTKLELGADGAAVDLRSRCLYFYEFGCKIAPLGLRKWYMTRTPMDKLVFTVTCHDLVLRQSERENNSARLVTETWDLSYYLHSEPGTSKYWQRHIMQHLRHLRNC